LHPRNTSTSLPIHAGQKEFGNFLGASVSYSDRDFDAAVRSDMGIDIIEQARFCKGAAQVLHGERAVRSG
jgi:hypothetical protein